MIIHLSLDSLDSYQYDIINLSAASGLFAVRSGFRFVGGIVYEVEIIKTGGDYFLDCRDSGCGSIIDGRNSLQFII
jgi:hypothetical protein